MDLFEGGQIIGPEGDHFNRGWKRQHQLHQQRRQAERQEPPPHDPLRQSAAVKLGDRAGNHHQQQEGENPAFDRQLRRPQLHLLEGEHARQHCHTAIQQGEDKKTQRHCVRQSW